MSIKILHTRLHYGTRHFYTTQKVRTNLNASGIVFHTSQLRGTSLTVNETFCPSLFRFKITTLIEMHFLCRNFFRYFQAGGTPEQVINQLSQNYTAVAQMANLLAEWLILAGVCVTDVQAMVENHLKDMILRTFDPKKADTIFTEEGEVINKKFFVKF